MDLGEYDTNILLINNVSSVSFRVYEPASLSSVYTFAVSDVESALRRDGHLVYADAIRRGIWCFYLLGRDGSALSQSPPSSLGPSLDVCGYKLSLVDEGGFEPISLSKTRPPGTNAMNTPNSSSSAGSALESSGRGAQAFSAFPAAHVSGNGSANIGSAIEYGLNHEAKRYSSVPAKEMYDYFLSAVMASLSAAFCAKVGAIALNARTLLLPAAGVPSNANNGIGPTQRTVLLATFRVYLTTTGSLVIGLGLSTMDGLMSSAEGIVANPIPSRVPVLVAPFGTFGTLYGVVEPAYGYPDQGFVQSPDTQIARFRPDSEDPRIARIRADCYKILELKGIPSSVLSGTAWVRIQHPRRRPGPDGKRTPGGNMSASILFWPAVLCFQKPSRMDRVGFLALDHSGASRVPLLDPLADTKGWLLGADERDATLAKRQKEREAAAAKDSGDGVGRTQHSHLPESYSPLALRRPSQSNGAAPLAGAMYPTPPDGPAQNPATTTPYVEGAVSSPANPPPHSTAVADADVATAMTQPAHIGDSFGDSWDGPDSKRTDQEFLGDMGPDIFGDNAAITDADFSFFDQPGDGDMDFSSIGDMSMGNGMDTGTDGEMAPFDVFPQKTVDHGPPPPTLDGTTTTTTAATTSPVFTKPELKHARSSLGDDLRSTSLHDRSSRQQVLMGIKRQPSPFTPETVFKRVKASFDISTRTANRNTTRRGSVFEKIDFDPYMALNSKKYQQNGRFECKWDAQEKNKANGAEEEKSESEEQAKERKPTGEANGGAKEERGTDREKENHALKKIQRDTLRVETPYLRDKFKKKPSEKGTLLARKKASVSFAPQQPPRHQSPAKTAPVTFERVPEQVASDLDDDGSILSDPDDPSDQSDGEHPPMSPTKSAMALTRRRTANDDDAISLAASLREFETVGHGGGGGLSPQVSAVSMDLTRFANTEPPEMSLSLPKYFADLEPAAEFQGTWHSEDEFVMVAQLLTEQAVSGRLRLTPPPPESDFLNPRETRRSFSLCVRRSVQELRAVLPTSLAAATECQFKPLLDLQDVPLLGQPSRIPPRPPATSATAAAAAAVAAAAGTPTAASTAGGAGGGAGGAEQLRPNLFPIPTPHFELRRHDARLSVLPSAVDYWESLGMGPWLGAKDALAVCAFPEWAGMSDHVDNFLSRMRNVYESLKLGSFDRLPSSAGVTDGMLPFEADHSGGPTSAAASAAAVALGESPGSSDMASRPGLAPPIVDRMPKLSQALVAASSTVTAKNFVVYFVYSPSNPASIVECCVAFQRLYEHFQKLLARPEKRHHQQQQQQQQQQHQQSANTVAAGGGGPPANELLMQLIPLDTLAEPSSLAIPPPAEYVRLCVETYDRCTLFDDRGTDNGSPGCGPTPAPAVVLERLPPRNIEFKLTTVPSTNVMYENTCMHMAYAQSIDDRWVTVAWTDSRGVKQMTTSYCLGRRGTTAAAAAAAATSSSSSSSRNGNGNGGGGSGNGGGLSTALSPRIAEEIWQTTEELISAWRVKWQVVITKCGPMEAQEVALWTRMQQTATVDATIQLTLLAVDTDPLLHLVPPAVRVPSSSVSTAFYTTPVSTPQPSTGAASMMSPEGGPSTPLTSGGGVNPPTTPGGAGGGGGAAATDDASDAAADAVLIDATDITWGAVLSHRLACGGAAEAAPSLASGYLVKRGGNCAEDPPVVMEVCIVHADVGPRVYELLLREILGYYRALGSLARARGMVDREADIRPWHVAAAEKGVQALYQLM